MTHEGYNLARTNLYAHVQHLEIKKEMYYDEKGLFML